MLRANLAECGRVMFAFAGKHASDAAAAAQVNALLGATVARRSQAAGGGARRLRA
jgi:hypothetical protein